MADEMSEREALSAEIAQRLAHPEFRKLLKAQADDGSLPVIPALPADTLSEIMDEVLADGGRANVVARIPNNGNPRNRYAVISITQIATPMVFGRPGHLDPNMTVDELIVRLRDDTKAGGTLVYRLGKAKGARADYIGVAA